MSGIFPESVSTFGGQIDSVFWLIFYIVGFFFIVAEFLLVYFAIRYRRGSRPAVYSRGEKMREAAWVLVPALIVVMFDIGIDAAGHRAWALVKEHPPEGDVQVKVTAKQFNWNFTFPGKDGKFGSPGEATLENELHVPVGKKVRVTWSSQDVIHSFWVPNLRLKQDVVPGRRIVGWFEVTKPGTYEIACAELCGFGHYSMHGEVVAQTDADYAKWRAETLAANGVK